jgi:hypothetical protein
LRRRKSSVSELPRHFIGRGTERGDVAVTLWTPIPGVLGLNIGRDAGCYEFFYFGVLFGPSRQMLG